VLYLITYLIKALDNILSRFTWFITVYFTLFSVACVTTYIYRTAHRDVWYFITALLFQLTIGNLVLNALELILLKLSHTENIKLLIPAEKAERQEKTLKMVPKSIDLGFVAIVVGRIMVGGFVQTFEGDPWWASIEHTSFLIVILFGVGMTIRLNGIFHRFPK